MKGQDDGGSTASGWQECCECVEWRKLGDGSMGVYSHGIHVPHYQPHEAVMCDMYMSRVSQTL